MDWDKTPWNAEPGALSSDRNHEYYEAMYTREEDEEACCCICGDNTVGLVKVGYQWICETCESQPENNYDPQQEAPFETGHYTPCANCGYQPCMCISANGGL